MKFFLVLVLGFDLAYTDETQAVLEAVFEDLPSSTSLEKNLGDNLTSHVTLRHLDTSKLSAVNITVEVLLPPYLSFDGLLLHNNDETGLAVWNNQYGNAEIKIERLDPCDVIYLNFTATITDETIHPGLHNAVVVLKLAYQSILITEQVATEKAFVTNTKFAVIGCNKPLGMTSGEIKANQLDCSSAHVDLQPTKARMDGYGDAWCVAQSNKQQYVEIELSKRTMLGAISTWGRKQKKSWVSSYELLTSDNREKWTVYQENGVNKVFGGNFDQLTEVKHWLVYGVQANFVRIRSLSWNVAVCMRFELYGCQVENDYTACVAPLGMETGAIPFASLTSLNADFNTNNSRLNKVVFDYPWGWQGSLPEDDWLQIDLGSIHQVTRVAIQGSYGRESTFYVTSFKMSYSNNTAEWKDVSQHTTHNTVPKVFDGLEDPAWAAASKLIRLPGNQRVVGRYFRVTPLDYVIAKVMRVELYGCMREDDVTSNNEAPVKMSRRTVLFDPSRNELYVCMYSSQSTSCRKTSDGRTWTELPDSIIGMVACSNKTSKVFAVDKRMQIVQYDGNNWYSISHNEWRFSQEEGSLVEKINIDDILPYKTPTDQLSIPNRDKFWGVSGEGIHMKSGEGGAWNLVSTWHCCGI